MGGILDLNIFEESDGLSSILDDLGNFFESTLTEFTELISSGELDDESFEEATRLTKEINSLNKKRKELRSNLEDLNKKRDEVKGDKTKEKMIDSKIKKIKDSLEDIKSKAEKMGSMDENIDEIDSKDKGSSVARCIKHDATGVSLRQKEAGKEAKRCVRGNFLYKYKGEKPERKPGELKKLHDELKSMKESFNMAISESTIKAVDDILSLDVDVMTESEIHGKAPSVEGSATGPNKHSGPTSGKIEISQDTYNDALANLKKSFNESMDLLSKCVVVEESADVKIQKEQDDYMSEAMLKAYEDGPLFEAVKKDDKDEIKGIVRKIRSKVTKVLNSHDVGFYQPSKWVRFLQILDVGGSMGRNPSGDTNSSARGGLTTWWSTRFWQILGACTVDKSDIKSVVNYIEEACKEELGDYKVLYVKMHPTLADIFRTRFNWKNTKSIYFLIIDKSIDKELKKELAKLEPKDDSNNNDDKKDEGNKKE